METVEVTLQLPKDFVRDAEDFGLLDPATLTQVLRNELDQRIMQMVDEEVKAYRAEKQGNQDS